MKIAALMLGVPILVLVACQAAASPQPTPGPTSSSGIEGLVADLNGRGAAATIGSPFLAEPMGGRGMTVCVAAETLQTYEFIDHEAALAASAKIDRQDPSHVGNAIVEWSGPPRFWLRDRVIVLYLGPDGPTDILLRGLLGEPFAESSPGRGLLPTPPCQ